MERVIDGQRISFNESAELTTQEEFIRIHQPLMVSMVGDKQKSFIRQLKEVYRDLKKLHVSELT